jgi:hypothetical protein
MVTFDQLQLSKLPRMRWELGVSLNIAQSRKGTKGVESIDTFLLDSGQQLLFNIIFLRVGYTIILKILCTSLKNSNSSSKSPFPPIFSQSSILKTGI